MPRPPYTAVLFDLDNTLADRDAALIRVAHAFYDWRPELHAKVSRTDFLARFIELDDRGEAGRERLLRRVLDAWPSIDAGHAALLEWFAATYGPSFPHDPLVVPMLTAFNRASVPWGIVTNGSPKQRETIAATGLAELTGCVLISEEVGSRKPGATIFMKAVQRLGLDVSRDVLFVGDNPIADIQGAQEAGLSTAWLRRQRPWTDPFFEPDHQIDHVTEVAPLVGVGL